MNSTELSCQEFITLLASDAPAPGGGGAAAMVGAIGTALGNMVGSLTVGKPKFADVEAEVIELKAEADMLQDNFIHLVAKDHEVFLPLAEAYGLPASTEEEKVHKTEVMEKCLVVCSEVPLEIMRTSARALDFMARMEQIGTPIAISDVGCGAVSLKAAIFAGDLNVRVNTKLMKDRTKAEAINAEADEIIRNYIPLADDIYQKVLARFS